MSKLDAIYSEIQSLRGADVRVFGQPTTLSTDVPELCVDALDVIDVLRPAEVYPLVVEIYDPDIDSYTEVECEDVEEYLQNLEDDDALQEKGSDNSYNWAGNVSNDFYFHTYETSTGDHLVRIAFHRYGDVRGNYTEEALLKFRYDGEFLETLLECSKYVDYKGYEIRVDVTSDTCEVCKDGDYVTSICDLDELDEEEDANE